MYLIAEVYRQGFQILNPCTYPVIPTTDRFSTYLDDVSNEISEAGCRNGLTSQFLPRNLYVRAKKIEDEDPMDAAPVCMCVCVVDVPNKANR
ncbi:hypothetical protein RUM44_013747 [Polyplax serrata]|uniref:Uncharacterized protein n=1 Tax=Polyplax serrata TaxID=468196 RepID=A0ABR1BIY9_POLSC